MCLHCPHVWVDLLSVCSLFVVLYTHPHGPVVLGAGVGHSDPVGPTLRSS